MQAKAPPQHRILDAAMRVFRRQGFRRSSIEQTAEEAGLTRRLAADKSLPRRLRVSLWLLLCYLVFPIDLIPDFVPVIGYADDAIIVTLVLRSVIRTAGNDAIIRHWPGTDQGLESVRRIAGF